MYKQQLFTSVFLRKHYPGNWLLFIFWSNMILIPLTQGKFSKIDDEDFEKINFCKWNFNYGYADGNKRVDGTFKHIKMHRVILGAMEGEYVDHINHDTLDNRKENLRICSASQNQANSLLGKNNTTGYKGVYYTPGTSNPYMAKICKNRKHIHLGCFKTIEEAALAYNKNAIDLYGEFAKLNTIEVFRD